MPPPSPERRRRNARWWGAILVVVVAWLSVGTCLAFLRGRIGDFPVFYHAAEAVVNGDDIYASHVRGYLYPPIFAVLLVPLTLVDLATAGGIWAILNGVFLLSAALLLGSNAARALGRASDPLITCAAAAMGLLIVGDKARASLMMGQTDALVLFLISLGLYLTGRRPAASGATIAGAMLIKYQAAIFVPYLVIRRRWRELAGVVAGTSMLLLAPALLFGWERNSHYLSQSLGVLGAVVGHRPEGLIAGPHAMTWDRSVSLTSAIARFAEDASVPVVGMFASIALACGIVAAIGWLIYRAHDVPLFSPNKCSLDDVRWPRRLMEPAGLIVAALAFSPQTEGRHMLLAAVLTIPTCAMFLTTPRGGVRLRLALAMLVLILGISLPPGGPEWASAVTQWRHIGGASVCLLIAFFVVLNESLGVDLLSAKTP